MAPKKKAAKAETKKADAPAKTEEKVEEQAEEKADAKATEAEKPAEEPTKDDTKIEAKEEKKEDAKIEAKEEAKEEAKDDAKPEKEETKAEEGGDAEMKEEAEAEPEEPVFKEEEDAAEDKRAKIKTGTSMLNLSTATPNAMISEDERLLMCLCDGGCQNLLSGVRSTVGLKAGRYMFEFKILEMLNFYESGGGRRGSKPENLIRVGFSLAGSDSLLVDGDGQLFFDSDGNFVHGKNKTNLRTRFNWGNNICVVLNLDEKSPHKNTVSLFRDGVRFCDPQPLPESFVGKALFPTISYKNVTLQMNFGPSPKKALPFKCRMIIDAATADVQVVTAPATGKDGKAEVLFPVGIPDHGIFDYMDQFLEEHPKYLELSDRKMLAWAASSGVRQGSARPASNDKPGMNFGIPSMDDFSAQKALLAVVPALKRDVVCMELNANLQAAERARALKRFPVSDFKRVAVVAMGDPSDAFKARIHKTMLDEKVEQAAKDKKKADEDKAWKKQQEEREQSKKRKAEDEETKDAEDGAAEEEKKEEDEKEEEEKPVELTAEEKAVCFRKTEVPDIAPATLTKNFASYSIPAKDEGFDEIRYVWSKPDACASKLKEWLLENKRTQRIDDLEPSEWFKERWTAWGKALAEWEQAQKDAQEAAKKKKTEEKKDEGAKEGEEEANKGAEFDEMDVDVFKHENINDIGNGQPLFANFAYEDWTLMSLRYELHLLVHAFRHDVNDADRQSFHESHFTYYYEKYFGKSFPDLKLMNLDSLGGLCELIKETANLNDKTKFVEVVLAEDAPIDKILRQTEQHRRERQQCVDAGDESASLKFTKPAPKYQAGGRGGYQGRAGGAAGGGRDQQWDRNSARGGNSDRGGSSWGSSSYGDKNASYDRGSSGGQEKRSYGGRDDSSQSKYPRNDQGGSNRGYDSRPGGGAGTYGSDRRGYR